MCTSQFILQYLNIHKQNYAPWHVSDQYIIIKYIRALFSSKEPFWNADSHDRKFFHALSTSYWHSHTKRVVIVTRSLKNSAAATLEQTFFLHLISAVFTLRKCVDLYHMQWLTKHTTRQRQLTKMLPESSTDRAKWGKPDRLQVQE